MRICRGFNYFLDISTVSYFGHKLILLKRLLLRNNTTLLLVNQTMEEIDLICRITATKFGEFLGTGAAY